MIIADAIDVIEKLAVPIGIAIAAVVFLRVPKFRKGLTESFRAGQQAGRRFGKREADKSEEEKT